MIAYERYDYTMIAGLNWYFPVKSRPGGVILVHAISIYNNSGANYGAMYKAVRIKGEVHRLNYTASLNNGLVKRWMEDYYITNGAEFGVGITPNAAGETTQVSFQTIHFTDVDYNKIFGL